MKKSKLTAKVLRGILVTIILVIIGASTAGFYFTQEWLSGLSSDISSKVSQSDTVGQDAQALQQMQADLAKHQDVITKSGLLIASGSDYQGKVIADLTRYASLSGIRVLNFGFETASQGKTSSSTTRQNGPKSSVVLSLESPIAYTDLLEFLYLVENNLPKMQVQSLSIARVSEGSRQVRVDKITIGVYTS